MSKYLSGLYVAGLGLCGGGWLVATVAFGGESARHSLAGRVNLLTGAALIAVCCLSLVCWSAAWRQRMRVDGVLADRFRGVSRREARRIRGARGGELAAATGSQTGVGEQAEAPEPGLPRRTPAASAFRPGAASVPVPAPRGPLPQVAVPDANDNGLRVRFDSRRAW